MRNGILIVATLAYLTPLPVACAADVDEHSVDKRSFSGVRELVVDNVIGFIEVTGYNGSVLEAEIAKTLRAESPERADAARKEVKLDASQDGGKLRLFVDGPFRCHCGDETSVNYRGWRHDGYQVTYDFKLKVPHALKLDLRTINDGYIKVRDVAGDFEVRNVNGDIEMLDIAGSGSAVTVNGPVKIVFAKNPAGPCTFRSVNGNLDVRFPDNLSADVRMKTFHGGLYTDFAAVGLPAEPLQPERRGGRTIYRTNQYAGIRIGQGGPELRFSTLNGNVYIRNKEQQ